MTRQRLVWGYVLVLLAAGVLYAATCAPGLLWQDSGMFQYRIWHGDLEGGLGLALAHPLYILLGMAAKAVPLGEFAYRVNLVSALAGAITVANLALLVMIWTRRFLPALIAALTLGLSHTFWQNACIAEVYTVYTALFLAELVVLLQYCRTGRMNYLYGLAGLNGLALADHMWAVIPLAGYAVFLAILLVQHRINRRQVLVMVFLWILAAGPYEYLIVKDLMQSGDVAGTLSSAFFGRTWQGRVLNSSITAQVIVENLVFLVLNFPTPNLVLFFAGLFSLYKTTPSRGFAHMITALLVLFFVFAFRYNVPDRYVFFLPFYCLLAVVLGAGAARLFANRYQRALAAVVVLCSLMPLPVYALAPGLAEKKYPALAQRRQIPYRDSYTYFLQPWQGGYRGAERFAREALASVEPNAVVYADGTTVYPLLLMQQVQGLRPDVVMVSSHGTVNNLDRYDEKAIERLLAEGAVYVASPAKGYCPAFLLEGYDFVPRGTIYRAVKKIKK